jgi:hypothetical protein
MLADKAGFEANDLAPARHRGSYEPLEGATTVSVTTQNGEVISPEEQKYVPCIWAF